MDKETLSVFERASFCFLARVALRVTLCLRFANPMGFRSAKNRFFVWIKPIGFRSRKAPICDVRRIKRSVVKNGIAQAMFWGFDIRCGKCVSIPIDRLARFRRNRDPANKKRFHRLGNLRICAWTIWCRAKYRPYPNQFTLYLVTPCVPVTRW